MRIYNPKGLETFKNLRCRIAYGDQLYETGNLDKSQEAEVTDKLFPMFYLFVH